MSGQYSGHVTSIGQSEVSVVTSSQWEGEVRVANEQVQEPDAWLLQLISVTDVWLATSNKDGSQGPSLSPCLDNNDVAFSILFQANIFLSFTFNKHILWVGGE